MRAVIYARYSSDQQSATSIDDQIRSCKAQVDKNGWTLVASYSDHAISGSIRRRLRLYGASLQHSSPESHRVRLQRYSMLKGFLDLADDLGLIR